MTKDEALKAKQSMTSVYATEDGTVDTAHHGIVVQVGYHESGREDLVAVEGHHGVRWFSHSAVRQHDAAEF